MKIKFRSVVIGLTAFAITMTTYPLPFIGEYLIWCLALLTCLHETY